MDELRDITKDKIKDYYLAYNTNPTTVRMSEDTYNELVNCNEIHSYPGEIKKYFGLVVEICDIEGIELSGKDKGACQDAPISTVGELIQKLKQYPEDMKVGCVWDGALRNYVNFVWKTRSGEVALCGYGETGIDAEDSPDGFNEYRTPDDPNLWGDLDD